MKKSISCYLSHQNPHTHSSRTFLDRNGAWSVQISLLIQTRKLFHWRKRYYGLWTRILVRSNGLKLKTAWWICFLKTRNFSLLQMLIDGLEWCGLLWCFYQLFGLSFWRHPFTAKHPLVSKWCNATFLQIWWRNKLKLLHLGWPEGEDILSKFAFFGELFL